MGDIRRSDHRLLLRLLPPHLGKRRGTGHHRRRGRVHRDPQQRLLLDVHRHADPVGGHGRQVRTQSRRDRLPADRIHRIADHLRGHRVLDDRPWKGDDRRGNGDRLRTAHEARLGVVPQGGLRRPQRHSHRGRQRRRHRRDRTPRAPGRRPWLEGGLPRPRPHHPDPRGALRRDRPQPSLRQGPALGRGCGAQREGRPGGRVLRGQDPRPPGAEDRVLRRQEVLDLRARWRTSSCTAP